ESTDLAGGFSIVDLATDAVELMNALDWPAAHVVGISMGGMVAQELVLHNAGRVRGLVIGCSYAGGPGSSLDAPGPMEMFQAMQTGDLNQAIRAAYTANLSAEFTADEAHFAPFYAASTAVRVPMATVMRQAQAAAVHSTQSRLTQITSPTLVMHGTSDRMLRYSNGELIASLIPRARLHTFDDVGHLFWWEQPVPSATAIRDHLLA
ncbi:MAG: alpha/beta hydrolase, partial [Actinomycetota bacterium]|nr:alpha/beta hydrolase [Actinomycetota bacterium]